MSVIHKCSVAVVAQKAGGLAVVRPCGKPASIKDGKGYICPEHALAKQRQGGGRG